MEKTLFGLLVWIWISVAVIIFIVLLFVTAPYGRHSKRTWYKAGIGLEDKKYSEVIKENYKIDDIELNDMIEFLRENGISIRDFCLNMNYIK